jgi:hypothetical protein
MSQMISEFASAPSIEVMLIIGRAIALVCGFLVLAWALSQWRRNAQRDTQRVFEQLDLVRSELLIMKEVMHDAAHRSERPNIEQRLPSAPPATAVRGYEIAARMARNGASKEELMRSAGITPHEAELLVKLHSRDARPATFTASAAAAKAPPANANAADASLIGRQQRTAATTAPPVQQREAVKAPPSQPTPRQQPKVRSRLVAVG